MSENPDVLEARAILSGRETTPEAVLSLAERLKLARRFGYARKVVGRVRPGVPDSSPIRRRLAQQHAFCTYRDPDLPPDYRLERALEILEQADDPASSTDQETLRIAGAIEKRRWEVTGRLQNLERSLAYYLRGYEQGISGDGGSTAINAAFLLDLLASHERSEARAGGHESLTGEVRTARAAEIRQEITEILPAMVATDAEGGAQWWVLTTIAEAYLGLRRYEEAKTWLERAVALSDVPEWQHESTARQFANLALLQEEEGDPTMSRMKAGGAWDVVGVLYPDHLAAVRSAFLGKVGLALSGGGFRASLFHIGVLARLAELDLLRHVEVISCVSGGSIIGAHYYLESQALLQTKPDHEITRDDYVAIVQRVADDFVAGVQKNIRTRVGAEFITNLKMIFLPNYSRTQRAGELYEKHIYSRVADGHTGDRYMDDLLVQPAGDEWKEFHPGRHNWLRQAKVPILALNATTLNTGHNWQFTATWMGEPPGDIDTDVDGNDRLRRMYYRQAPPAHQRVRLGHAVAASACVPGLFEPLELPGLYPERTVRLVDGGVHDNQGVAALIEQECTVVLVSDASGQMSSQDHPSSGLLGVPLRSNDILMARVRAAQFEDLGARRRATLLRGLMFLHLKSDLPVETVDWIGCEEPAALFGEQIGPNRTDTLTRYGIPRVVQEKLAAIRTDLDSFCDVEAYALMASGYRMAEHHIPRCLKGFPMSSKPPIRWKFLSIEPSLRQATVIGEGGSKVLRVLDAASGRFFKIWQLLPALRVLSVFLAVAALAGLWVAYRQLSGVAFTLGWVMATVGLSLAGIFLGRIFKNALKVIRYRKTFSQVLYGIAMALVGWLIARTHLHVFDRMFLKYGSVDPVDGTAETPRMWWPVGVRGDRSERVEEEPAQVERR